jgi:hypothetical protein
VPFDARTEAVRPLLGDRAALWYIIVAATAEPIRFNLRTSNRPENRE